MWWNGILKIIVVHLRLGNCENHHLLIRNTRASSAPSSAVACHTGFHSRAYFAPHPASDITSEKVGRCRVDRPALYNNTGRRCVFFYFNFFFSDRYLTHFKLICRATYSLCWFFDVENANRVFWSPNEACHARKDFNLI